MDDGRFMCIKCALFMHIQLRDNLLFQFSFPLKKYNGNHGVHVYMIKLRKDTSFNSLYFLLLFGYKYIPLVFYNSNNSFHKLFSLLSVHIFQYIDNIKLSRIKRFVKLGFNEKR